MNASLSQRLTHLAVLPLCTLLVMAAARAAEPPSTPAAAAPAPASASASASADEASEHSEDTNEHTDWRDQADRHGHHRHGDDLVSIGHDSNLSRGQTAGSVVSIFGSSISDGEAGGVVSILGDSRVTGEVSEDVVAVLGNVYIDSKIDGDTVAVLGNIDLGPHAEIGGDIVAVGGTVRRDPAAIVHGEVQNVLAADFGAAGWLRSWIHHCLFYGRPLSLAPGLGWAWGLALACLALYAGLALLFRDGLTRCVQTFERQPGQSVLAALIAMLLTPVLVVLLCITVIGIAAVPFVLLALFCVALFGKAVMLAWVGRRVAGGHDAGPMSHPAAAVLIGGALVLVLYLIPVLGFLVYKLLGFLGLGAVVYTLILAVRAHQAPKEGPAGSPAGAAATPGATPVRDPPPAHGPSPGSQAASFDATQGASAQGASTHGSASSAAPSASAPGPAPTPQAPPVTAALPRAGFWVRMGALLIDALLVGFVMGVLGHSSHMELLALAAYGAVMWKLRGSTVGGIVFDLGVVRLDGREIDWETAIVRALGCFLSLAVAGLGFLWIAFDHNNQAWHDKIAGTVVVRVAKGTPLI
jgi:uncharacterized RDD family membrane protein YckC